MAEDKEMLSIDELATRWGVHKNTVRKMMDRGDLKTVMVGERNVRFPMDEVKRYERQRKR